MMRSEDMSFVYGLAYGLVFGSVFTLICGTLLIG